MQAFSHRGGSCCADWLLFSRLIRITSAFSHFLPGCIRGHFSPLHIEGDTQLSKCIVMAPDSPDLDDLSLLLQSQLSAACLSHMPFSVHQKTPLVLSCFQDERVRETETETDRGGEICMMLSWWSSSLTIGPSQHPSSESNSLLFVLPD